MNPPKTVCVKCKWHRGVARRKRGHDDIWYVHTCKHPDVLSREHIDPVTGQLAPTEYPYCRDINHGDCEKFEKK